MHTQRMRQMLRLLKGFKPKSAVEDEEYEFNLSIWYRKWAFDNKCGTVACACGHAAMDPWFIEQGFRLRTGELEDTPSYESYTGWNAVSMFFQISDNDAVKLFSPHSYSSTTIPMMVYDRILQYFPELREGS